MSKKNYFLGIKIWICITIFYCYQYILRVLPGNIMPELLDKYGVNASEYGAFVSSYYFSYVAMQIPLGVLLSKYGCKKILPIFMVCTFLGVIPIIYSENWYFVIFGRFLTGFGASAAAVGGFQMFRIIFKEHFGRALGLMLSVSLLLMSPITRAIHSLEFVFGMNILILIGFVLTIITFFVLPKETKSHEKEDIIGHLKSILSNYKLLFVSILAGLMISPLEGFADGWGASFLNLVYGIERQEANSINSSILLGLCIGAVIVPYIAEKTKIYYGAIIVCALIMLLSFGLLLSDIGINNLNMPALYILFILIGIASAYQIVALSKIATYVKDYLSGIATAIGNMIFMGFGSIFHIIIGFTMEKLWDGTVDENMHIYNADSYIKTMSIIPIAMFISVIGFLFLIRKSRPEKHRIGL